MLSITLMVISLLEGITHLPHRWPTVQSASSTQQYYIGSASRGRSNLPNLFTFIIALILVTFLCQALPHISFKVEFQEKDNDNEGIYTYPYITYFLWFHAFLES